MLSELHEHYYGIQKKIPEYRIKYFCKIVERCIMIFAYEELKKIR